MNTQAPIPTNSKKSGKGMTHGLLSELTLFFHVREGEEEAMRQACTRFDTLLRGTPAAGIEKTSLHDVRLVVFDEGRRLMASTTFDADWLVYISDAIDILGAPAWADFLQHTTAFPVELRGADHLRIKGYFAATNFLQAAQTRADCFFQAIPDRTLKEVKKALRVERAFEQVLEASEATTALRQPGFEPLLAEASD